MPLNPKAKLVENIQDKIFCNMSADKKLEVAANLWLLAKALDPGKIDFRIHEGTRGAPFSCGFGIVRTIIFVSMILTLTVIGGGLYYFKTGDIPGVNWLQFQGKYLIWPPVSYTECVHAVLAGKVVEWPWQPPVPCEFRGEIFYPESTAKTDDPQNPSPPEPDTATWRAYRNEKYGFEIRFPRDAILTVDDLSLGAMGHKKVSTFSPEESYMTIESGDAFVSICKDCGGGGLGIGNTKIAESVVLGAETYTASGYYQNDQELTSKIMLLNFDHISVIYGFRSAFRHPLTEEQIKHADRLSREILHTLLIR
ncbi:MAG: hypothetical protein HYT41_02905 [Candidatus Sungbacteria bacterium]|nr:hypothetical protein [Candidatus Sungbacteria bacterium]